MELMVSATAVETKVMKTRPLKSPMAARTTALRKEIERVPTASAMEFAASVDPFTKMVPAMSAIASASKGLAFSASKNCPRVSIAPTSL